MDYMAKRDVKTYTNHEFVPYEPSWRIQQIFSVKFSLAIHKLLDILVFVLGISKSQLARASLVLFLESIQINEEGKILITPQAQDAIDKALHPSMYGITGIDELIEKIKEIQHEQQSQD